MNIEEPVVVLRDGGYHWFRIFLFVIVSPVLGLALLYPFNSTDNFDKLGYLFFLIPLIAIYDALTLAERIVVNDKGIRYKLYWINQFYSYETIGYLELKFMRLAKGCSYIIYIQIQNEILVKKYISDPDLRSIEEAVNIMSEFMNLTKEEDYSYYFVKKSLFQSEENS